MNLRYDVIPVRKQDKLMLIQEILARELTDCAGGAIVFTARRRSAETIAAFLRANGWPCVIFTLESSVRLGADLWELFLDGLMRRYPA